MTPTTATIVEFPSAAVVRPPSTPTSGSSRRYSLSPAAKWEFFRAAREDQSLPPDAVAVLGRLLDFYQQDHGFSSPSPASCCKALGFFRADGRSYHLERFGHAIAYLIDGGYIGFEKYEIEPGSGFPGFKFFPIQDKRRT